MKFFSYKTAALVAALVLAPGTTQAQWIADGFATTSPIMGSAVNDSTTVNYAVFKQTTTGSSGTLATYLNSSAGAGLKSALISSVGSSGLAKLESDKYVYFYQLANPAHLIKEFYVGNPGATNVVATANGYVFQQNGSAVTSGKLGSNPGGGSITGGSSTNLTFAANGGATKTSPDGNDVFGDTGNPNTEFTLNGTSGMPAGGYSGIMVLGSNNGPQKGEVETGDGGQATAFGVPVPGPEPGTFALLGFAFPIFGVRYIRRLKNRVKSSALSVA
jgi:hypothetical protein